MRCAETIRRPEIRLYPKFFQALSTRYAAFIQLLKETGMRPGEAYNLTWEDIDPVTKQVHITPEKGSNPRVLPISNKALAMLLKLKSDRDHIFKTTTLKHFRSGYNKQRKRIAKKLENPRINRIQFKTMRHFKGTMEYHKTKDILYVKQVLGHKNIKNTLVYTQLVKFSENDEYIVKVTRKTEEAQSYLEMGYSYIMTDPQGLMFFRIRK